MGVDTSAVTLNKLGLLSKAKPDGSFEHRIIWDLLRSRVNEAIRQGERTILPRLLDIIRDALELAQFLGLGEDLGFYGIDIAGAFHNIPIHTGEKRFVCAMFEGVDYVFDVTIFGSRSSPTVWGRYGAWLGRSTSSLFQRTELRVEVYVDDPPMVAAGSPDTHRRLFTVALLWMAAAGFPLAWAKAERGGGGSDG